jgi:hypothetical protein
MPRISMVNQSRLYSSLPMAQRSSRVELTRRSKSGMQVPYPTIFLTQPETKRPHACYSFPGAQGGEAERA